MKFIFFFAYNIDNFREFTIVFYHAIVTVVFHTKHTKILVFIIFWKAGKTILFTFQIFYILKIIFLFLFLNELNLFCCFPNFFYLRFVNVKLFLKLLLFINIVELTIFNFSFAKMIIIHYIRICQIHKFILRYS
jgi:hypothetical protein